MVSVQGKCVLLHGVAKREIETCCHKITKTSGQGSICSYIAELDCHFDSKHMFLNAFEYA